MFTLATRTKRSVRPRLETPTDQPMSTDEFAAIRRAMGDRLRRLREALGLTQEGLANELHVSTPAVSAWEIGRNEMSIARMARFASDRRLLILDYLAMGDLNGLRFDLATRIQTSERAESARPSGPRRRGPKKQTDTTVRDAQTFPPVVHRTLHEEEQSDIVRPPYKRPV